MGIYRTVCYKVEDIIVKVIAKKKEPTLVKEKVATYRKERERLIEIKRDERDKRTAKQKQLQLQKQQEQKKLRLEREESERKEVELLISEVMDIGLKGYSTYEFNEIKRNKIFFQSLIQRVLEPKEKALTFIYCEYDKSSKKEIKGYLIPTNKRILFLTKNLDFMDKFRYQTVINVSWFKDSLLERGIHIQYGKRKLEFDEIFDQGQMQKVGNTILNKSTKRVHIK